MNWRISFSHFVYQRISYVFIAFIIPKSISLLNELVLHSASAALFFQSEKQILRTFLIVSQIIQNANQQTMVQMTPVFSSPIFWKLLIRLWGPNESTSPKMELTKQFYSLFLDRLTKYIQLLSSDQQQLILKGIVQVNNPSSPCLFITSLLMRWFVVAVDSNKISSQTLPFVLAIYRSLPQSLFRTEQPDCSMNLSLSVAMEDDPKTVLRVLTDLWDAQYLQLTTIEEKKPMKDSDAMMEQVQDRLCAYLMKTDTLMAIIKVVDTVKENESCVDCFCDLLNEMLFHWGVSSV